MKVKELKAKEMKNNKIRGMLDILVLNFPLIGM
jgi:hypothetical protein